MATIPTPTGWTGHWSQGNWCWVSWDEVPEAVEYEYSHEFGSATTRATESSIFAIPHGDTRSCKVRSRGRNGETSGWVTVTLSADGVIVSIDGDDPEPPPGPPSPPGGLRVQEKNLEDGYAVVAWDSAPPGSAVDHWLVLLEGETRWRKATVPRYTFRALNIGETYGWRVRAVNAVGQESAPTRSQFTFGDTPAPDAPHAPRNVRAHCVQAHSAKIEWDENSDNPDGYRVELSDGASLDLIGTLAEIRGLIPETEYTATVYAHTGDRWSAGTSTEPFWTGADKPNPDPPPDPDAPAAPTGLYVDPVSPGAVRASWNAATGVWWAATIDDQNWVRCTKPEVAFTGVAAGAQRTVQVYALRNGNPTSISRVASAGVVTARMEGTA